jgi:hypothetical protein
MYDEALVPYYDIMDEFELGLHFLNDTFGVKPHVVFQIDCFGHSAMTPSILSRYGIDTIYLARIGTINKFKLKEEKTFNFIW